MNGGSTSKVAAVVIAIVLSALAVFMLVTAYTYSRSSGIFPIFVGWIFVALALLESVVQLRTLIGRGATAPAASEEPAAPGGEAASLREIGGFFSHDKHFDARTRGIARFHPRMGGGGFG